jgi:hypothetical protein
VSDERELLRRTAEIAADILDGLDHRRAAIRVSVSGWRTTEPDIDRTVAAFEAARLRHV